MKSIASKNLFLNEPYIHALVNLKRKPLIVLDDLPRDHVVSVLYEPGYKEPRFLTRGATMQHVVQEKHACIFLSRGTAHFEALLPQQEHSAHKEQYDLISPPKKRHKQRSATWHVRGSSLHGGIDLLSDGED